MRSLFFIILASYAVKCDDDASYYVVEIPDETRSSKPFQVYWNVPTMQCKSKKIPFENLYEKFGIKQNTGDSFRGDEVAILYDPGVFPALLKNESSGKFKFRNGGVPQEGNLSRHWNAFKEVLEQSIPDPHFSGIGIIDFESWRPIFRQNFGILAPYKDFSYQIERKQHWFWPEKAIQAKAKQRFEEAARSFMQTTLVIAKELRPNAQWGYYAYPYCFNMAANSPEESCSSTVRAENDKISWLWQESSALFPSTYFSRGVGARDMARSIRGRVAEAARLRTTTTSPILPYFWFRYRDGDFLPQDELNTILETFYNSSASGFIIWGSSGDVNTVDKCSKLLKYTEEILGPAIAKYTKLRGAQSINKVRPETTTSSSGITTWRTILNDHLADNKTNGFIHNTPSSWFALENNNKSDNKANNTNNSSDGVSPLYIKRNSLLEILFNILLYKEMMDEKNVYSDYDADVVLPQNGDPNQNVIEVASLLANNNDTIETVSSTVIYTTIDPLKVTTAKKAETFENYEYNQKQEIVHDSNRNDILFASEFSRTTTNNSLHDKNQLIQSQNTNSNYIIDTVDNIKNNNNPIIIFDTLESPPFPLSEDSPILIVKQKKEASGSSNSDNTSDDSLNDFIKEASPLNLTNTVQINHNLSNSAALAENNTNTELPLIQRETSTKLMTSELPNTIINSELLLDSDSQKPLTLWTIITSSFKPYTKTDEPDEYHDETTQNNVEITTTKEQIMQTKSEEKDSDELYTSYSSTSMLPLFQSSSAVLTEKHLSIFELHFDEENETKSYHTTTEISSTMKVDDSTDPILLFEEKIDISDYTFNKESEPNVVQNDVDLTDDFIQSSTYKKDFAFDYNDDGSENVSATESSAKDSVRQV